MILLLLLQLVLPLISRGGLRANESNPPSFVFKSIWFDSGNVLPTSSYGTPACIINGGILPNQAEYKIVIPETGRYALHVFYAAQAKRPTEISIDGQFFGHATLQTTGSWNTSTAIWEKIGESELKQGERKFSMICKGPCIPHIVAFRLEPLFKMTGTWSVPRPLAKSGIGTTRTTVPADGWFANVALDRAEKKESGETFTDHFGRETIAAQVPENELTITLADNKSSVNSAILLNEMSYYPGMFAPTDSNVPATDFPATDFTVRLSRRQNAEKAASVLARPVDCKIGLSRYRLLLDKSQKLLERLTDDFGTDALQERYGDKSELQSLGKNLAEKRNQLHRWQQELSQKDSSQLSAARMAFAKEFFSTIRLYARLGLANPLLNFENLLFVRRNNRHLGLVQNWQSNSTLPANAFDDTLCRLHLTAKSNIPMASDTVFKPEKPAFIGDIDLHFDANKLLFSSTNEKQQWNVFEIDLNRSKSGVPVAGKSRELLPRIDEANAYDACYLPDDSIMYTSSACYIAVPCVNGSTRVTNMYRQYNDPQKTVRRLTFDQEHNWCPVVMEDGRVLYQRWEYADTPHAHARLLFLMNPDGTSQMSFYGTNSYWPNALFYARPIPGDPTKFVAIVSGHHGVRRMGELVLFDVKKGRKENQGAVQRLCAKSRQVVSKTNPKYDDTLIVDCLVNEAWPKFLHPWPLSDQYYLVSSSLEAGDSFGIYLVDTDDNMILLAKEEGMAYMEPVPLAATERPPVIADRVDPAKTDATVFIADIYEGEGLKGVPRGTVKNLRLFTYNYLFPNMGGPQGVVGADGPWDIRNTLGTVPIDAGGSALFKVPANTPIALQPLDENGKEIQLMRSWFTAMPGEILSCIGCHEDQNSISPSRLDPTKVQRMRPREILPWYGPQRGFSFREEVQPVLDRYCVACHHGAGNTDTSGKSGKSSLSAFDLRGRENITDYSSAYHTGTKGGGWSTSYDMLHRFVRRPGMESDYHLLMPTEFAAETTDLYRLLVKGHYGVQLDAESWDRIITWIDLNAPYNGYWHEQGNPDNAAKWNRHRVDVMKLYKSISLDQEKKIPANWDEKRASLSNRTPCSIIPENPLDSGYQKAVLKRLDRGEPLPDGDRIRAEEEKKSRPLPMAFDWAFDSDQAKKRQADEAEKLFGDRTKTTMTIAGPFGVKLDFQLIPRGKFLMGAQSKDTAGHSLQQYDDETACIVEMTKPFWMSTTEITNEQFEKFHSNHDSGVESRNGMQFGVRGFYVNGPELPVVRVSWNDAVSFCQWLSEKSGRKITLPTEGQWEYACRAGTSTPFNFGTLETDFGKFANLADHTLRNLICHPYFKEIKPMDGTKYDHWIPRMDNMTDGGFLTEVPKRYPPNAWGLFDMHGNAAEWTRSLARPYPYSELDGRNDMKDLLRPRIVRGGSWRDRPMAARSEFRYFYRPWQGVFNVGFRVVSEINVPE